MKNLRTYGQAPFKIALIHGGPGAAGEIAPVARELAGNFDILEPIQTATSLTGQVEELKNILAENGSLPVTLVGFSWGAWLSFIFTANYSEFVEKLILIGSGPFEAEYAEKIMEARLARLSVEERSEVNEIMAELNESSTKNKNSTFARFGSLLSKADIYNPIKIESEPVECNAEIFQGVWSEAAELRRSGELLRLAKNITCPVVAIHGDYDPHPAEGVRKPLADILDNFRFILLKKCGHKPWVERDAREKFFQILKDELR